MGANLEIFDFKEDNTEVEQEDLVETIDVLLVAIEEAENKKAKLITERSKLEKELSELKSTIT